MTKKQARSLKRGDKVYWDDPDKEFDCSRYYTFKHVTVHQNRIEFIDVTGDVGECHYSEIELVKS